MRTLKFRAYSKKLGMSEPTDFKTLVGTATDFNEFDVYMQFTGLVDRHGVEIYEGDIVKSKFTDDSRFIVEWSDLGCWWGLVNVPDVESGNNLNGSGEDFEVIGNIYENQELKAVL